MAFQNEPSVRLKWWLYLQVRHILLCFKNDWRRSINFVQKCNFDIFIQCDDTRSSMTPFFLHHRLKLRQFSLHQVPTLTCFSEGNPWTMKDAKNCSYWNIIITSCFTSHQYIQANNQYCSTPRLTLTLCARRIFCFNV